MAASVCTSVHVCVRRMHFRGEMNQKKKKGKHHVWKLANPTHTARVASPPGAQDVTPPRRDGR